MSYTPSRAPPDEVAQIRLVEERLTDAFNRDCELVEQRLVKAVQQEVEPVQQEVKAARQELKAAREEVKAVREEVKTA